MGAHDSWGKGDEAESLQPFFEEYEAVTGKRLVILAGTERPDFIVGRGREPHLGLELTRVMQDPRQLETDKLLHGASQYHPLDAAGAIHAAILGKEDKRASPGWQCPRRTILVVQLYETPLEELVPFLYEENVASMVRTGFREIWLVDYTPVEPHGTVQLMCLKPDRWRGVHSHRFSGMKPYG